MRSLQTSYHYCTVSDRNHLPKPCYAKFTNFASLLRGLRPQPSPKTMLCEVYKLRITIARSPTATISQNHAMRSLQTSHHYCAVSDRNMHTTEAGVHTQLWTLGNPNKSLLRYLYQWHNCSRCCTTNVMTPLPNPPEQGFDGYN
jgi:hypothetical protein